jgi:hypothetical protein
VGSGGLSALQGNAIAAIALTDGGGILRLLDPGFDTLPGAVSGLGSMSWYGTDPGVVSADCNSIEWGNGQVWTRQ